MQKAWVLMGNQGEEDARNCYEKENVNSNKVCSPSDKKMPLPATRKAQFSLEDICMYLYGHTPVEPAVLEDQLKLVKQEESSQDRKKKRCLPQCPSLIFPDEVRLCKSSVPGAEFGVCAAQPIPPGTWIGPYEGQVVRQEDLREGAHNSFMWEIYKDGKFSHFIDGSEEFMSSWMRFIQCARYKEEQNMTVFQYCGSIYYRAFRHIPSGRELLVWYDEKYSEFLDIPALMKARGVKEHTVQWKPAGMEEDLLCEDSRDQDFEDPDRSLDPFGLGLKDHHGEPHIWRCGQCSQTFSQRVLLQMHVCPQSPDRPYQCGHCPSSFPGPAELREHVVIHINEKPFKCGFCGRSFAGATTLNNHIRTHTGEKPFKCDKCHKTFSQSTQLSRHQKSPEECHRDDNVQ
ncbi:putative histone-lysine N-methyltransferase PRDM6 isoform X2 [Acropora millepora]|uniref:putative histone-lysine N-methyltransferase PRDM6 isoform X2 n=1 Tax=Acropora millepora TaxID=45264 RepID=UPI001CF37FC2|nr:putative histone-lysine N-methyltransferase PRDM6 isoform X2 [Acropora millepora]